jgi:hypothetical protein
MACLHLVDAGGCGSDTGKARIQRRPFDRSWRLVRSPRRTSRGGYAWVRFPDRIREVHRGLLEFWHDPPGCALTDGKLRLLRRIAFGH